MPSYLVLNRFDDEFGEYHRFVEPGVSLAYLTLAEGLAVLDTAEALDTVVVPDLDFDTVRPLAHALADRVGGFAGVVGLSEYDLVTAARLGVELGVPGWRPGFVMAFRDKPRMKEVVAGAGLRVPQFVELDADATAGDVVAKLGLPVILKPRAGAASTGVVRVDTMAELAEALATVDPAEHECEEFIDGEIYHVDGVRRGGEFHFVSASVYLNTCLDFARGQPLGSVLLDPGATRERVVRFGAACLDALLLRDGAFHLELFETRAGDFVFLEVGLRPGGGEIPFVHRDLFGIDLLGESFRAALGMPPLTPAGELTEASGGGFVMVPEPRPLPSRVLARTSLIGEVPHLYAEIIPDAGEIFDGHGGYGHIGGRFHLAGPSAAAVSRSAREIMSRYQLRVEPA